MRDFDDALSNSFIRERVLRFSLPTGTAEDEGDDSKAGEGREEHRRSNRRRGHGEEPGGAGDEVSVVGGVRVSKSEHGG